MTARGVDRARAAHGPGALGRARGDVRAEVRGDERGAARGAVPGAARPAVGLVVGGLVVGLVVGAVAGCARDLSRGDVLDALRAQSWPADATVESGEDPGGGRYERPRASARSESPDEPWRAVDAQVEQAVAAGWVPVYAQCAGPQDSVRVDLVREVLPGVPATATVTGEVVDELGLPVPLSGGSTVVSVAVVAAAPQDVSDPVLLPTAVRAGVTGAAVDLATCLDEPAASGDLRWAGTPAALPTLGGPLPR